MFLEVYLFLDLLLKYKFTKARVFVWFWCSFDFTSFYSFLIYFFILKPVLYSNYIAVFYIILWLSLHWKTGWPITNVVFFMGLYTGFCPLEMLTEWLDWIKSNNNMSFSNYTCIFIGLVWRRVMCLLILNKSILSLETELTCFAMIIIIYPNETIGSLSDSEKNKWLWNILMYYTATYKMTNTIFGLITNLDNIVFLFLIIVT